jgi:hypothetical protein
MKTENRQKLINATLGVAASGLIYGSLILLTVPAGRRLQMASMVGGLALVVGAYAGTLILGFGAVGAVVIGIWYLSFRFKLHTIPVPPLRTSAEIGFIVVAIGGIGFLLLSGGWLQPGACTRANPDC